VNKPSLLPADPTARTITFLMIVATLSVSMAPVLITLCGLPAPVIAAGRLLITAILMAPFAWSGYRDLLALSRNEKIKLLAAGLLFGLHFLCFTEAFAHTSFESAVILLAAQPLIAAVLAWIMLGERTTPAMWVRTFIAGSGLILLISEDVQRDLATGTLLDAQHLFGDLLVLLAGVTIVMAFIFGRKLRQKISAPVYTSTIFFIGGLVNVLSMAIHPMDFEGITAVNWMWLGGLVLIPTIMGHSIFQYLVKHVRVFFLNLVILTEPLVAMSAKWLINDPETFGEMQMTTIKLIGGATLIVGVTFAMIQRERTQAAPKPVG